MAKRSTMGLAGLWLVGTALAGCQHYGNSSAQDHSYARPSSVAQPSAAWNNRPTTPSNATASDAGFAGDRRDFSSPGFSSSPGFGDSQGPNNLTHSAPVPSSTTESTTGTVAGVP